MIIQNEKILKYGKEYILKVKLQKRNLPYKATYFKINFEPDFFKVPDDFKFPKNNIIYIKLKKQSDNIYSIFDFSVTKPHDKGVWIKSKIRYHSKNKLYFDLPCNKYYLNKKEIEILKNAKGDFFSQKYDNVTAVIKVLEDKAVIKGIYFNDLPIMKFIKQKQNKGKEIN